MMFAETQMNTNSSSEEVIPFYTQIIIWSNLYLYVSSRVINLYIFLMLLIQFSIREH